MNELDQKINIVSKRMIHHARHSGYDRLVHYMNPKRVFSINELSFSERAVSKLFNSVIRDADQLWYHRDEFINELHAAKAWMSSENSIFHFIYGENSYRYFGNLKKIKSNNKIVCTYHTPEDKFHKVVKQTKHLIHIDAVITMSTIQVDFLSKLVGRERVHFVPHGIDINYFKPFEGEKKFDGCMKCLFVGSHLRDFETLINAVKLLEQWKVNFEVVAVVEPDEKHFLDGSNISVKTRISDEELLQLYQQSDVFLIPLLESTANNSLLEAMACGLPIVCTDLVGIKDYVNNESAIFVTKKDSKSLADAVVQLACDETLRKNMATASRIQGTKFCWETIAKKTQDIYKSLLS